MEKKTTNVKTKTTAKKPTASAKKTTTAKKTASASKKAPAVKKEVVATHETVKPEKKNSAFEGFTAMLRKKCSGDLMLVLAILISVSCLFSVIKLIGGNFVSLIFYVLATIGIWLVFAKAKSDKEFNLSKTGLIRSLPIFQSVLTIIGIVAVVLVAFAAFFYVGLIGSLIGGLSNIGGTTEEEIAAVESFFAVGTSIIAVVAIIALVVLIFFTLLYIKTSKIIKAYKIAVEEKKLPNVRLHFTAVLSIVLGGLAAIGSLLTFGPFDVITPISTLVESASMIIFGIFLIKLEKDMKTFNE